ncbi:MAG TPA: LuxR C-terminal-related transcriptional regulator [Anaerolineae bacterium]|nr:LuxR C-terminal-related transcriptional regulator [Anaerolineae bacterium]
MTTRLLTTKLHIPPVRPEWVPRPRLVEWLDGGLWQNPTDFSRKLTLFSAPAGSGKTALVTAWLSGLRAAGTATAIRSRVGWLSLDEGDNDPLRFFAYVVTTLQAVDPQIGQDVLRWIERSPPLPVESLVTSLINDIAGTASPVILVLDDCHVITDLVIHEAVGFLLEHQPPNMHLVITTRHDPPLPLSRLRGRGQIAELRQSDLRFTPEEAAEFLNRSMRLPVTPSEIAALEKHTEGWITGLQLAALSMQGRDPASIAQFVAGFSGRHHFILEYLTDEVLRHQPQPVQTFLLQTSVLDRMCGALCDAVLGHLEPAPGRQLLEQLEAANLFVVPLDDEREWYRFHHLFAELLRARLQETAPDLIPELHRRAAAWYEQTEYSAEAVHHALATGDYALAAEVIEHAITQTATWSRINVAMIQRWLSALPDEAVQPRPRLRLFMSRILYISGQPELAGKTLQALEEWLHDHPSAPDAARMLSLTMVDRASYAAVMGHVHQAKEFTHRAIAHAPEDDPIARFRAPAILGMAHLRAGEVLEAQRSFSQAAEIAMAAGLGYAAVPFLCNLAETEIARALLRQAMQTCERAGRLAVVAGVPSSSAGFVGLEMAKILLEWNDLDAAQRRLSEGLELLVQSGISESFGSGQALLAQIRQALGDREGALAAALKAVQIAERESIPRVVGLASACLARIRLSQEQLDLASDWAGQYCRHGETEYLREFEDLTLVRVLLAEGRPAEALALLDARLSPARDAGRMSAVIEIQILRALALSTPEESLDALQQALTLAEPAGYVRLFLDQGEPMRALLKQAAARGIAPRYVSRLLAAFGPSGEAARKAPQPLVEPLTGREMEVLHLLAEDLPNREIGRRLFISLPTVKSHTRSIYGKLGVHGREEAVARAQALGILLTA